MDSSNKTIVILGKTGSGKSSLANTMFGETLFEVDHTSTSGTLNCQKITRSVNGRSITLIDTPGFFDTRGNSEEKLKPEIIKYMTGCSAGVHAFLILLKVEKYTEQEEAVINKIKETFSEEAFKYATVVFTHGDELQERQTIEDFVRGNEKLSYLVRKCGGRCHVIDNKRWKDEKPKDEYRSNKFQVDQLLQRIDKMVKENNNRCYTNEMLQAVEEMKRQERERIRQTSGNRSEEEINEEAENNVFYQLMIAMAGTGTGVVLGALFGVKAMTKVIFKALEEAQTAIKAITTLAGLIKAVKLLRGAEAAGGGAAAAGGGGAAAAGGAAAGGGGAAAAEAAVVALKVAVACYGTSAVVGAFVGGYEGLKAAQKATSMTEAVEMAANAVNKGGNHLCGVIDNFGQSSKEKEN